MRSVPTKSTGDTLSAIEFNEGASQELQNAVLTSGQTLSSSNLNQLGTAMSIYGSSGDFYNDGGSANAYVLAPIGAPAKQAPPAYSDGTRVRFVAANTNTGASTINLNSLGVKSLKENGTDVAAGRIKAGAIIEATFLSVSDRFELVKISAADFIPVDTIAILQAINTDNLVNNQRAVLGGYFVVGDGGGDGFFLDSSSTETANGGTIIIPTFAGFSGTGRWKRIHKNMLTLKDFGVKTDGSFMEVEVQSAIDVCSASGFFLEGIDGDITLDNTVNLKSGLLAVGTGKTSSRFVASATLGTKNLFSAISQTNISISQFGFDMRNDIRTGDGSNAFIENALFFENCKSISIHKNDFVRDINFSIMVRGVTLPEDSKDIFIYGNSFANGARSAIEVRRFAKNVHVYNNTMLNVVDSSKSTSGVPFDKPIAITGSVDCYIYNNEIVQNNGEGGAIIFEFLSVACRNVHMYKNSYIGALGGNAYKAGDCFEVYIIENSADGTQDMGVNIAGCTDVWVLNNILKNCGRNSIIVTSDLSGPSFNVRIGGNTSINPNQNGAALGAIGVDGSSGDSYHIQLAGGGDHMYVYENILKDTSVIANGIKANQDQLYIHNNDLTGLANGSPSSVIAINNRFMDPLTQTYEIIDNPGFPTTDKGTADITSSNTSVVVSPNVVVNSSGLGFRSHSLASAMNGTQAYSFTSAAANSDFNIVLRTASHGSPTNTATVSFQYERDISRVVDGALAGI